MDKLLFRTSNAVTKEKISEIRNDIIEQLDSDVLVLDARVEFVGVLHCDDICSDRIEVRKIEG